MDAELAALSSALEAATRPKTPPPGPGPSSRQRRLRLATAESCTGGWAAQVVTHTAGSSEWFDCGFVTYSNEAKIALLDVDTVTLAHFGSVSAETAAAMAVGALAHSRADLAVAITGIAGPGGGSSDKPVGTVCFAWCLRGPDGIEVPETDRQQFSGDREAVRRAAVIHALQGLEARAKIVP